MKRVFLTSTLPENALLSKRGTVAADVKRALEGYKSEKSDYSNHPTKIRPIELEKYGVNKTEKSAAVLKSSERESKIKDLGLRESNDIITSLKTARERLPIIARNRANRLIPHLAKVNLGSLEEQDEQVWSKLLYDLTVPNVKNIKSNRELLESVTRQLVDNSAVNSRDFVIKSTSDATKKKSKQTKQVSSHPTRGRKSLPVQWHSLTRSYYKKRAPYEES